jgi:hypothetical protein
VAYSVVVLSRGSGGLGGPTIAGGVGD